MSWLAVGAAVGSYVADKGGGSVSTTQKLLPGQGKAVQKLFNRSEDFWGQGAREFFPGSTVAEQNPFETASLGSAHAGAQQISQNQLPGVRDASQFGLGFVQDIPNNPVVQAATEAAINPVQQRLERQVLPGLDSAAVGAGQTGSSRHGVVQANALNDFSRAALDATAGIQNQALGRGMDLFSNTLAQQPAIAGLEAAPADMLDVAGQRQRGFDQAGINENIARHNFGQNEYLDRLQQYRDLIMGNFGGTTTRTGGGTSTLQGAAGGALLAGGLLGGGSTSFGFRPTTTTQQTFA